MSVKFKSLKAGSVYMDMEEDMGLVITSIGKHKCEGMYEDGDEAEIYPDDESDFKKLTGSKAKKVKSEIKKVIKKEADKKAKRAKTAFGGKKIALGIILTKKHFEDDKVKEVMKPLNLTPKKLKEFVGRTLGSITLKEICEMHPDNIGQNELPPTGFMKGIWIFIKIFKAFMTPSDISSAIKKQKRK